MLLWKMGVLKHNKKEENKVLLGILEDQPPMRTQIQWSVVKSFMLSSSDIMGVKWLLSSFWLPLTARAAELVPSVSQAGLSQYQRFR